MILKRLYNNLSYKYKISTLFQNTKTMHNPFDPTDPYSLQQYINAKVESTQICQNTQKYMMMIYGPPACGKSKGVEYGIQLINNFNNERLERPNFLEINLDDIIGDIDKHKRLIDDQLKILNDDSLKDKHETSIKNIKASYLETRKDHENIVETLIEECVKNNLNFTMESTGSHFGEWYFNLFRHFMTNDYKIVLVYPCVTNEDVLVKRAYSRGLKLGRFVTRNDYKKCMFVEKAEKNFEQVLENKSLFDIIYKYDGEKEIDIRNNTHVYDLIFNSK